MLWEVEKNIKKNTMQNGLYSLIDNNDDDQND